MLSGFQQSIEVETEFWSRVSRDFSVTAPAKDFFFKHQLNSFFTQPTAMSEGKLIRPSLISLLEKIKKSDVAVHVEHEEQLDEEREKYLQTPMLEGLSDAEVLRRIEIFGRNGMTNFQPSYCPTQRYPKKELTHGSSSLDTLLALFLY
jgi:hypothetical protein